MQFLKQSTAVSKIVGPILDSTGVEYASAVIGDLSLSKNGATLTALASAATLTYIANGYYTLALTTGNTDTLGSAEISCNKATYQMPPREFMVLPSSVYDALVTNAAGSAGGLHVIGTNSGAVSYTAGMTISNASGSALTLSSGGGNGQGLSASGNGTGDGISATGGATGRGIHSVGGATSGAGFRAEGTAGNSAALELVGQGSAAGLNSAGGATGAGAILSGGATSGVGLSVTTTSGDGLSITPTAGHGMTVTANGTSKHGLNVTGGATSTCHGINATGGNGGAGLSVSGGATGPGAKFTGGGTSGDGIQTSATSGHGATFAGTGTTKHGINATANGATSHGINAAGSGVGHGILGTSGLSGASDGIRGTAISASGSGFNGIGAGTGSGVLATGGTTGAGMTLVGGATSGAGLSVTTTSGDGLSITPTAGNAIAATANGTSKHGAVFTGGTGGTSDGFKCAAGTGGVDVRGDITGTITAVTTLTSLPAATTDWLTADAVKADAVTKIQSGLSTYAGGDTGGTTTLLSRLTSTRAGYLDNLNVGGPVASQADVQAVNQSAGKHLLIQTVGQYERPESGNVVYTVEVRTFSASTGAAVNADSTPTLTAIGQTTGDLSANLGAVSNPATGVYRATYTVSSAATLEPVRFDVSATIAGSAFTLSCYSQVVDLVSATWTTADATRLTAIYNKLPANNIADETLVLAAVAGVQADADDIQTRLPAALVSGRMDASVGAYPGNTPQTGDAFARIGLAGVGLTDLGDTRIAHLNADVDSRMATYAQPTGFLSATFPAAVAATGDIPTAVQNADTTLRRTMAHVEASGTGDAVSLNSLYGLVQQAQFANSTAHAGKLTVFKTDGTTELGQKTLAEDAAADPITGIS